MSAQIIRTPSGDELIVLPRAEYDALVSRLGELEEDASDVAAYDLAKADAMTNPGRVAVSADAMKGALIRRRRKELNLTQGALAEAAGLQQGFVSDLESGRRRGSVETIEKISAALNMDRASVEALKRP